MIFDGELRVALQIGKNDAFERRYMGKFAALAAEFGEFVKYERDRAARDIGLHFVESKKAGGEIVAPSLVWFQMKGIQSATLPADRVKKDGLVSIPLDVAHLQFWYIAPDPTYLALYVESLGQFLVLDLQDAVGKMFGDEILTLKQKTATVTVPIENVLDEQAFYLIKKNRSVEAWKARIKEGESLAPIFFRDASLVWNMGQIADADGDISMTVRRYGSKTRSEVYFHEIDPEGCEGRLLRAHWQLSMPDKLEISFPYIDFDLPDGENDGWDYDEDDFSDHPNITLPNGKSVRPDGVFEMVEYEISVRLNKIGQSWLETLRVMEKAGFIEITAEEGDMVSVAPWHGRGV